MAEQCYTNVESCPSTAESDRMPPRKGNSDGRTKSGSARKLAGDKTREKIMDSAELLFADHGMREHHYVALWHMRMSAYR
jgi:hypothetical protein